jgi:hypothetical protein
MTWMYLDASKISCGFVTYTDVVFVDINIGKGRLQGQMARFSSEGDRTLHA